VLFLLFLKLFLCARCGNKTKDLNTANINALKDVFGGDVKYFYKRTMGADNYNKLFG
jgi:hypothetical protein